jgi:hypothetical protein
VRKKMASVLLCVFLLAFAIGAMVSTAQADDGCFATCINGVLLVCCPLPGGGYDCDFGGACDWPGWIP